MECSSGTYAAYARGVLLVFGLGLLAGCILFSRFIGVLLDLARRGLFGVWLLTRRIFRLTRADRFFRGRLCHRDQRYSDKDGCESSDDDALHDVLHLLRTRCPDACDGNPRFLNKFPLADGWVVRCS